jgi:hypothetical protein
MELIVMLSTPADEVEPPPLLQPTATRTGTVIAIIQNRVPRFMRSHLLYYYGKEKRSLENLITHYNQRIDLVKWFCETVNDRNNKATK